MDKHVRLASPAAAPSNERGIALVIVLWVLALLTVMSMTYSYFARIEAMTVRNAFETTQARYAAEAGVQRTLWVLASPVLATRWPANGAEHTFATADGMVRISAIDESGFININRAGAEYLDGLFKAVGIEAGERRSVTAQILDWRDTDSIRNASGAEDSDYAGAGLSYTAKDAPFESVEELLLLLAMSPSVYSKVEPFLTVYSSQSGINVAAAPREVLLATPGISPEDVEAILTERAESTYSPENAAIRGSGTYRISVRADLPSGGQYTLRAIVRIGVGETPQFTVLNWKEAA